MRRKAWATCWWPGLSQLWTRGSWSALAVAVGTATLLNLALVDRFVWTELFTPELRRGIWLGLLGVWLAAAVISVVTGRGETPPEKAASPADSYAEALEYYLQGDWFQAERVLGSLVQRNGRDLDARLMLATLMRHTGRSTEATQQLDAITRFDGAEKWAWEIHHERQSLNEAAL